MRLDPAGSWDISGGKATRLNLAETWGEVRWIPTFEIVVIFVLKMSKFISSI